MFNTEICQEVHGMSQGKMTERATITHSIILTVVQTVDPERYKLLSKKTRNDKICSRDRYKQSKTNLSGQRDRPRNLDANA